MKVYLNGEYVPQEQARISVDDRGFNFADGVYEVCRIYSGHIFLLEPHMQRLRRGLADLRIPADVVDEIPAIAGQLLELNPDAQDATLYIQITRGTAPRAHAFPNPSVPPTVFVAVRKAKPHPTSYFQDGVATITVPDTRWSRCDIKSIALLPNVLANQQAKEAGAFEALFVRDGAVIEGSHSNLFGVLDGELWTAPSSGYILSGITRAVVIEQARALGLTVREEAIPVSRIAEVTELFLSGTTTEVMPVTSMDGKVVAAGMPGPITRQLRDAYPSWIDEDRAAAPTGHGVGSGQTAS